MKYGLKIAAAAVTLSMAFSVGVCAAGTGGTAASSSNSSSASSSANLTAPNNTWHFRKCHHHGSGMEALSKIAGMSVEDLQAKYPQKTSWQIAQQLGKLSELKTAVLAQHKQMIDSLVAANKITADEGSKMYADLQKRVSAIDGKSTVILGKPGYRPQFKKDAEKPAG